MKKLSIVCALCALVFSACSKENSPKVDPTAKYQIKSDVLAAPSAPVSPASLRISSTAAPSSLRNIELTESGDFIAYADGEKTKGADADVAAGKYSFQDGKIQFTVSGNSVQIQTPVQVPGTVSVYVNGTQFEAQVGAFPSATPEIVSFCRTWYPVSYHASIMSNGKVVYNKVDTEAMSLQKDLLTYIYGAEPADEDLFFNAELESFIFTKDFTAAVCMKGIEPEVCSWSISPKQIDMKNQSYRFFLNGNEVVATPYFKAGNPNTMYIMIDLAANLDANKGDYNVNVSGRLVITMADAK